MDLKVLGQRDLGGWRGVAVPGYFFLDIFFGGFKDLLSKAF